MHRNSWILPTFSVFSFSSIIHNSCCEMFYTAVFVVYAGNISTANILMLIFCLYLLISVKYLVSIISIFAALNDTFIVNISILFTFMFLKIRILFHNIPISFTFMFHDI